MEIIIKKKIIVHLFIIFGILILVNPVYAAAPDITGFPTSISIIESKDPSVLDAKSLYTLAVTDPDGDTFSCGLTGSTPATDAFVVLESSGAYKVFLAKNPPFEYDTQNNYALAITCTDSTGNSSSVDLTVYLTPNTPPDMSVFPGTTNVNDGETAHRKIYDVTVTDVESDNFTCTLDTVGTPFNIQKNTGYEIWFENLTPLDASTTPSYTLTITCSDDWGSSQGTLTVTVNNNSPPVFTGLPTSEDIKESDPGGVSIYNVTVSDPEVDVFSCGLGTVNPTTTAFTLPNTGGQYSVSLSVAHSLDSATTPTFVIIIECSDGATSTSTGTLTVNVLSNTPPTISGLSAPLSATQGESGDRILQNLTVTDAESDSYTCLMTSTPTSSNFDLRYIGSVYSVYLNANPTLTQSTYTLNVTCSDAYGYTSETVNVLVTPTSDPVIQNLPSAASIVDTNLNQTLLHNLTVNDADGQTVTCSISSTPTGPFILIQDTSKPEYLIYRTATVATDPVYTVTATCTDTAGGSDSADLTVTVTVNSAPVISGLPDLTDVSENLITEKNIWNFTVADAEGDTFICTLSPSPTGPFDLRKDTTTGIYSAYVTSSPNLDYNTVSEYNLTLQCTDSPGGKSSSGVLKVNVIQNRFPAFTNLAGTTTAHAINTVKGDSIFTVTATDADNDTISYSLSTSPSTTSFTINSVTGEITAAKDLKYELTSNYILTVTASDSKKTASSTLLLTLTNINTAPVISNLALNQVVVIYKSEFLAAGDTLFTNIPYDPDTAPTLTTTMTVSPAVFTNKFDFSANVLSLAAGETFDYEYYNSYLFTFYITDTMAQTGPYYLRVLVIDEAEPCVFKYTIYKSETYESSIGGGDMNPGYGIMDEDNPDSVTYSLLASAYRNLYQIDPSTGEITFAVNYDIDGGVHPQNLTLLVKCEDTRGQTGTATVSIYVKDINDNTPEFATGVVWIISQWTAPGSLIGTLNAQDIDQNDNADVEYYGTSVTGSAYFVINTNGNGYITTDQHFTWDFGTTHRFMIKAIDQGSPRLTGTTTLDIIYRNITTTTTTTTVATPYDWWSDPGHIALVVFASLLALLLLALLLYLLIRFCRKPTFFKNCCKNCCKRQPPKPKISKKPNPKPEPFKFWDENDNNKVREMFSTQRNEADIPEPMKIL